VYLKCIKIYFFVENEVKKLQVNLYKIIIKIIQFIVSNCVENIYNITQQKKSIQILCNTLFMLIIIIIIIIILHSYIYICV